MRTLSLILTLMYGVAAAYTLYMAATHLFVYFANQRLGYPESPRMPMIYLTLGVVFSITAFIGYKIWTNQPVHILMKGLFYLPIGLILLYVLWGILLLISSGGKWN